MGKARKAGTITVGAALLMAYLAGEGINLLYLFDIIPPVWLERAVSLAIICIFGYMLFYNKGENDRMIAAVPFMLVEQTLYQSYMDQLWARMPWILGWAIVFLTYELSKKFSRGVARRIGESLSSKWAIAIYIVLIVAFVYTLYVQGYLGSP